MAAQERERLQLQSLSAMQEWEASGRHPAATASDAPPVFRVYAPPTGLPRRATD